MKIVIIAMLIALVASATAANTIKFVNHCPYDVFYWIVGPAGSNISGEDYERTMVPKYNVAVLDMVNSEPLGGGLSIKMRDLPHYRIAPAGIVQVEYNLQPSQNSLWYDLSAIDCDMAAGPENPARCPLVDGGIEIYIPGRKGRSCKKAGCVNKVCKDTYTEHGSWYNEPTHHCGAGADLVVETCTHNPGQQTFDDKTTHEELHPASEPDPLTPVSKKTSPDGTCGFKTGYTCKGSRWGDCCSSYGFCGRSEKYCSIDTCEPEYGVCPWVPSGPLNVSTDGTCGQESNFTCKGSTFGQCCSEYGYCGDSDKFCKASTCKRAFGVCPDALNSTSTVDVSMASSTAFETPSSTIVSASLSVFDVWPKATAAPSDMPTTHAQPLPRDRIIPLSPAWEKCGRELSPEIRQCLDKYNSVDVWEKCAKELSPYLHSVDYDESGIGPRPNLFLTEEMKKCVDMYYAIGTET